MYIPACGEEHGGGTHISKGKQGKCCDTPVRNICNVGASYSSFVFVMPIVALRRLSLSPV